MDTTQLIESLRELFTKFNAGLFIGISACLYVIINVLRGKAGFKVPFITKLWNKIQSKNFKNWAILFLFGVAGGLVTLGADQFTIWLFLDGFLAGIGTGIGTIGTRHVLKNSMESPTVGKLKKVMKRGGAALWVFMAGIRIA